jgi:hypothetical protein
VKLTVSDWIGPVVLIAIFTGLAVWLFRIRLWMALTAAFLGVLGNALLIAWEERRDNEDENSK